MAFIIMSVLNLYRHVYPQESFLYFGFWISNGFYLALGLELVFFSLLVVFNFMV